MELQEAKEQVITWMNKMKHGYRDSRLYMCNLDNAEGLRIKLFTENNAYSIVARPPKGDDKGYLGCIADSRTPRAGEDWTRGNDLADGKFTEETWIEILYDIIGYELVKIHRPIKRLYKDRRDFLAARTNPTHSTSPSEPEKNDAEASIDVARSCPAWSVCAEYEDCEGCPHCD